MKGGRTGGSSVLLPEFILSMSNSGAGSGGIIGMNSLIESASSASTLRIRFSRLSKESMPFTIFKDNFF